MLLHWLKTTHLSLLIHGERREQGARLGELRTGEAREQRLVRAGALDPGPDLGEAVLREPVGDDALRGQERHQAQGRRYR
jgi:hypothetical protein